MEKKAKQLWAMLDEMCQENPEAYKQFVEKHLKEGNELFEIPKPHMCIQTIDYNDDISTIVNVFEWATVPPPKSESDPIPICDGIVLEDSDAKEGKFKLVSVAFHPSVLKEYGRNSSKECYEMLIGLALNSLENQYKMKLSRHFTLSGKEFIGDNKLGIASLMKSFYKSEKESHKVKEISISNLLQSRQTNKSTNDFSQLEFFKTGTSSKSLKPMIEEISTKTPCYEMSSLDMEDGKVISLKISLPGIKSSNECQLDVSEDDILLEANGLYSFHLDLKEQVIPSKTLAKFIKQSSCLELNLFCAP